MDSAEDPRALKWAKLTFLSLGNFDVTNLRGYDKATDTIYFTALGPSPGNRHLFSTKGSPTTSEAWRCLTCRSSDCTFQYNQVTSDFKRVLTWCKGPALPRFYLSEIVRGKTENTFEILRSEQYEQQHATFPLPLVTREKFPLKEGFGEFCTYELSISGVQDTHK
ncbi:hypothetical protein Aduo_001306 [Ancylostoma duodenale]